MEGIEPSEVATSQSMVAPCAPRHFISKRVITFMSNVSNIRIISLTSFLGLSVVLCCAIFRVVQACPSEVTSPLVKDTSFGGGIRTLMRSYLSVAMQPSTAYCASPSHITHSAYMLVLARYFAFHVAAVSSFTTLISRFHLTAVRLVIEHCLRSHTQTFKEGFMCLTENLGFGFPSASFRSKLYLSSLTTLTSRLMF